MKPIRTFIIDESISTCETIISMINEDSSFQLVGRAHSSEEALHAVQTASLDVIALSVDMPNINEKPLTQAIMEVTSVPIVILAKPNVYSIAKTVQAISNGAVEFVRIPKDLKRNDYFFKKECITKLRSASQAKPKLTSLKLNDHGKDVQQEDINVKLKNAHQDTIIAIGSSTGGPRALEEVLHHLPSDLDASILIVQHMPASFTRSLADRLNRITPLTVKEAIHKEAIQKHTAYIAPGNFHMKIEKRDQMFIELTQDEERLGHRPSINVLFESLANINDVNIIAIILTGMGKDGAEGIVKIKKNNEKAIILTESKETAVIYGMPQAAMKTNLVDQSLPVQKIGKTVVHLIQKLGGLKDG